MLDICTPTKKTVLDQLADTIRKTLDGPHADSAISFSQQFYAVSAAQELSAIGVERLCATVLSYWKTVRCFKGTTTTGRRSKLLVATDLRSV